MLQSRILLNLTTAFAIVNCLFLISLLGWGDYEKAPVSGEEKIHGHKRGEFASGAIIFWFFSLLLVPVAIDSNFRIFLRKKNK